MPFMVCFLLLAYSLLSHHSNYLTSCLPTIPAVSSYSTDHFLSLCWLYVLSLPEVLFPPVWLANTYLSSNFPLKYGNPVLISWSCLHGMSLRYVLPRYLVCHFYDSIHHTARCFFAYAFISPIKLRVLSEQDYALFIFISSASCAVSHIYRNFM